MKRLNAVNIRKVGRKLFAGQHKQTLYFFQLIDERYRSLHKFNDSKRMQIHIKRTRPSIAMAVFADERKTRERERDGK